MDQGLAPSEREARALCLSGDVLVAGQRVDKAGTPVDPVVPIRLRGQRPYASRGGEKLAFALRHFAVDVSGCVALDCGASTGGFTDCLLRHGAARVYAVDAGFGQLLGRLRQDPRVVNLERTNLGEVGPDRLDPLPSVVTLDLSYLPLAEAWRIVGGWLPAGADVISLVKPLFEVDDPAARRTGRIRGDADYLAVLERLVGGCAGLGWSARAVAASPLRGSQGTVEFLLYTHAHPGPDLPAGDLEAAVRAARGGG